MRRWPLIRHLRWLWLAWGLARWWHDVGKYYWVDISPADVAYLDAVWKGEA